MVILILIGLLLECCIIVQAESKNDHDNGNKEVFEVHTEIKPQALLEEGQDAYWKKFKTKLAVRKFLFKTASKLIEVGEKVGVKKFSLQYAIKLTANHPLGYIADLAQLELEVTGHETAGKWVGALGNTAAGFLAAGPVGAAVGLGIWCLGETVEYETAQYLEYVHYVDYLDYVKI